MSQKRAFGLDIIRCVAILFVLISHVRPFLPWKINGIFGYFGVDLFFVLCGFLIGRILIDTFEKNSSTSSLVNFWIRRWFRTLPNYFLFLLVAIVLFYLKILPAYRSFFSFYDIPKYVFFLQNLAWVKPQFYAESWSLAVEEWFYILFPTITFIFITIAQKKISVKINLLIVAIFILMFSVIYRYFFAEYNPQNTFDQIRMIVLAKLDGMMLGVMVALLKKYYKQSYDKIRSTGISVFVIVSVFVFYVYSFSSHIDNPWVKTFLPLLASLGISLSIPYFAELRVREFKNIHRCVSNIALWSYSIYLVNPPIQYILLWLQQKFSINNLTGNSLSAVLFIGVSIGISKFIYQYYELPFLKIRDLYWKQK